MIYNYYKNKLSKILEETVIYATNKIEIDFNHLVITLKIMVLVTQNLHQLHTGSDYFVQT